VAAVTSSAAPGRGRRPGGPDTRGEILESARVAFAAKGYGGTTIRAVATGAGVDPALVHHYFGTKDDLFLAALQLPMDPRAIVPVVFKEGVDGAAERLLKIFFSVWEDPQTRMPLVALVRSGVAGEPGGGLLRDALLRMIFEPLAQLLAAGDARLRAELVATQMLGLIVARYVLEIEPLATTPPEQLIPWLAPTIDRYFTAELPGPPAPGGG
jgi:AcrR family transcriptional regulator